MTETPDPVQGRGRIGRLLDRATRSAVVRSLGVLVGGTALAHGITAAAMPLATRIFTPQDFAAASAFSSLVGILVVASCLRYELAIPLPDEDEEAANLLALSAISVVGTAGLTAVVLALLPQTALAALGQPSLSPHLWLLPIALLIGGLYLALQMWFVRKKGFGPIARSRIVQSVAATIGQLGLGVLGFAPLGLLVGQMLNYGAGAATLGAGVLVRERAILSRVTWSGIARAARIHNKFPRYSIGESLANAAAIHLPILMIAALAAGPEAGYLALAIFLLQAPMALVGTAVGQVYLSGAPEALREGRLAAFTEDMLGRLIQISAGPIVLLALVSPALFGLVFGEEWTRSGVLVAWMAPWFFFQFLSSPISTALHVTGRQGWAVVLQVAGLALRVGAVIGFAWIDSTRVVEAYAISGLVFYLAYLVVAMRAAGIGVTSLLKRGCSAAPGVLAALALTAATHAVLMLTGTPAG